MSSAREAPGENLSAHGSDLRSSKLDVRVIQPPLAKGAPSDLEMLENILFWDNFKDDDCGMSSVVDAVTAAAAEAACPASKLSPTIHGDSSCIPPPPASSPSADLKGDHVDGPPDNVGAFFGHPLTRATIAINGEDQGAQAEALFHEYINLPAIDKDGARICDKLASIIRCTEKRDGKLQAGSNVNDYINILLQNDEYWQVPAEYTHLSLGTGDPEDSATDNCAVRVKSEPNSQAPEGCQRLQKTISSDESRRGAARRQSHERPSPSVGPALKPSESEPVRDPHERLDEQLGPPYMVAAQYTSADVNYIDNSRNCLPPVSQKPLHQQQQQQQQQGEVSGGVGGHARTQKTLQASLTVTASVVHSAAACDLLHRSRCVLASSSPPAVRLAAEALPSAGRSPRGASKRVAKGNRATRSSQSRGATTAALVQKGQQDSAGLINQSISGGGTQYSNSSSSNNNNKPNAGAGVSATTTVAAPSPPSVAATVNTSPPLHVTAAVPSTLSPPVASQSTQSPAGSPSFAASLSSVAAAARSGAISSAACPASPVPESSAAASRGSAAVVVPLTSSAGLQLDGVDQPVVVTGACAPSTSSAAAQDACDPVKQATKEKLRLRIAQTTMTQPLQQLGDHTQHQHHQQQQQQHQQQQLQKARQKSQGINQDQDSLLQQDQFQQQERYKLHQQHQHHLHHQHLQAQTLQQQPVQSPSEALSVSGYFDEDDLVNMSAGGKYGAAMSGIKREDQFLDFDPPFAASYQTENSLQILYNSVPMVADGITNGAHNGMVAMTPYSGDSQQVSLSEADQIISQMSSEPVLVQSQYLHLLQPLEIGQQQPQLSNNFYGNDIYVCPSTTTNNNSNCVVNKLERSIIDMDADKQNAMRYMQQQQQQQQQHHAAQSLPHDQYSYQHSYQQYMGSAAGLDASSDSGISNDPGLSPKSIALGLKEPNVACTADGSSPKESKSLKRRKSGQNPVYNRQYSSGSDKLPARSPAIQKLEVNTSGYQYFLESPISTTQRLDEDRVTYLNKSQYYPLTLENVSPERVPKGVLCKSIIMLVFRDEKSKEEERKAWQFWHSRQHSYKQRILDIDTKNSQGVGPNSITELAFNAVSVKWNPRDGPVRVNIAVHCLSTDFSNQKGVKGIPLHIQIDTHEILDTRKELLPVHRGYCQIKVFCDKGAERKTRDEERRRNVKAGKPENNFSRRKRTEDAFHSPCDRSEFYSMANLSSAPFFFSPAYQTGEFQQCESPKEVSCQEEENSSHLSPAQPEEQTEEASPAKAPRLTSCVSCNKHLTPLLYIKESSDKAYHAIHLEVPTVEELLKSIGQKFNKPMKNVANFYKKSKKGILVRMDDNIVRHYSHETAFLLEMNVLGPEEQVEVVLVETCQ